VSTDYAKIILPIILLLLTTGVSAQTVPLPWWNDRVFYEIFVRSFYDSDGDGIGDLQGVIDKLDYLNDGDPHTTDDLGITGIWLMPIMDAASYHGYDVTDYLRVHPDYGTNDDFLRLIDAAHARGIAVIIDLVINHTSSQHPWFQASAAGDPAYADWYVWADADPGFVGPSGQRVWHPRADRFYYGLFWGEMPDLNLSSPSVTAELYEIARFWLEEMGVDGFRLDAAKHLIENGAEQEHTAATLAWLRDFKAHVKAIKPDALLVGEVWSPSRIAARYVPDAVDLVFDFELAATIVASARGRNPSGIRAGIEAAQALYPFGQYAAFLTNHDQNRVMSEVRSIDAARLAAAALLTAPGVPFIYYGEEIGMQGRKPDERIRAPMQWDSTPHAGFTSGAPWQPLQNDWQSVNAADQADDPASLLSFYRDLIHLRSRRPALRHGSFHTVSTSSSRLLAFLRRTDEERLLVIFNFNTDPVSGYALNYDGGGLESVTEAQVIFGSADQPPAAPSIDAQGGFSGYAPLPVLPERSVTILALQ
jgi:alpha-amylase